MKIVTTTYKNNQKETRIQKADMQKGKGGMQSVYLFPDTTYQTFLGFGGAITEAAGYAYAALSEENREKVLELYFGEQGNGYRMVRSHIDSCDFSLGIYTAMDDPEDREMKSFSLERDEKYILPLLRAATKKSGEDLDIMLSPWSPPAFMKTNGDRKYGGKLKPEFHGFWAEYICRYIREYESKGFRVSRITVQNEPEAVQTWDSCIYEDEEEKVFLRDYLYPALIKNHLTHVKINIWDHNKERVYQRAKAIIDKDTDRMVDGIAFHWYSGDHFEALNLTQEAYPDKQLIFTEGCVEYSRFDTDQLKNAQMYAHDIIGNLNAGMTGSMDWNILLDKKGGPNHVGNYCDAPIMIDTEKDTFEVKLSYDYIGHFSRYIRRGAKRIAFTKYTSELEMTAFRNMDGSLAIVLMNRHPQDIPVTFDLTTGKIFHQTVPGNAITTILIDAAELN